MSHIRYIWGAAIGALLFFLLASHSSQPDIWRSGVEAELAAHKAWAARSTALQQAALRNRHRADSLGGQLALATVALGTIQPDTAPGDTTSFHALREGCAEALRLCALQGAAWRASSDSEGLRASLAEEQLSRADSLLRIGLKVASCKVLWIPCPSRTASLVGGLVAGAVLGRAVR